MAHVQPLQRNPLGVTWARGSQSAARGGFTGSSAANVSPYPVGGNRHGKRENGTVVRRDTKMPIGKFILMMNGRGAVSATGLEREIDIY